MVSVSHFCIFNSSTTSWCSFNNFSMGSIPRTNFIFRFEYFFDLSPRMNANTTQTQLSSSFYISPITYLWFGENLQCYTHNILVEQTNTAVVEMKTKHQFIYQSINFNHLNLTFFELSESSWRQHFIQESFKLSSSNFVNSEHRLQYNSEGLYPIWWHSSSLNFSLQIDPTITDSKQPNR